MEIKTRNLLLIGGGVIVLALVYKSLRPQRRRRNRRNNQNNGNQGNGNQGNDNTQQTCPQGQELFEMDCANPPCRKVCVRINR